MFLIYLHIVQIILLITLILIGFHFAKKLYNKVKLEKIELEKSNGILNNQVDELNSLVNNLTKLYNESLQNSSMKADFFTNIIHELKTPLSVILSSVQLIEKKNNFFSTNYINFSKQFIVIKQNCYRLLHLINNILDMSKVNSEYIGINPTNMNIVYLIEEIVQSVVPYANQKDLILEFDTDVEELVTGIDMDKMERIMLNLLSNAIKFTDPGGKISVRVYTQNNMAAISVKDTGSGIPEDMQAKIFQRFEQANCNSAKNFSGSGIGLSLVKSFVELHNGTIKLNSKENEGSEFIVELPIKIFESDNQCAFHPDALQNRIIQAINIEFSHIYTLNCNEKQHV